MATTQEAFALLVITTVVLNVAYVESQYCNPSTNRTCLGRSYVVQCSNGILMPEVDVVCSANQVCYAGSSSVEQMCGPAPPTCVRSGNFPVPGRCRDFYACVSDGNSNLIQAFLVCEEDFEFNAVQGVCTTITTAGCSVSAQTTPSPICLPFTKQPDPTDCRFYYQCGLLGRRTRKQCPSNKRFDENRRACIPNGNCGSRPLP